MTIHIRKRLAITATLILGGAMAIPASLAHSQALAQASDPPTCTVTTTTPSIVVDANDNLADYSFGYSFSYGGEGWPMDTGESWNEEGYYSFIELVSPDKTVGSKAGTGIPFSQVESGGSETYQSLVEIMAFLLQYELVLEDPTFSLDASLIPSGSYTLTLIFSTTGQSLTEVCKVSWNITYVKKGDTPPTSSTPSTSTPLRTAPTALPETGSSSGAMVLWALALMSLGAFSMRTLARRHD